MSADREQAIRDARAQISSWEETIALVEVDQVSLLIRGVDATSSYVAELRGQVQLLTQIIMAL
jgi:hypothetical protein